MIDANDHQYLRNTLDADALRCVSIDAVVALVVCGAPRGVAVKIVRIDDDETHSYQVIPPRATSSPSTPS